MSIYGMDPFENDIAEQYIDELYAHGTYNATANIEQTLDKIALHQDVDSRLAQEAFCAVALLAHATSDSAFHIEKVDYLLRFVHANAKNAHLGLSVIDALRSSYNHFEALSGDFDSTSWLREKTLHERKKAYEFELSKVETLLRKFAFQSSYISRHRSVSVRQINYTPWNIPFVYAQQGDIDVFSKNKVLGAAVLPVTRDKKVILVTQRRPALGWERTYEIPRGGAEPGETTGEQVARRELFEETGLQAQSIIYLGSVTPDSGFLGSKPPVYFAEVENINEKFISNETTVVVLDVEAFKVAILSGRIDDGYTCYAACIAMLKGLI